MQDFIESLEKRGYSRNTVETYRRALKRFNLFLKLNDFTERAFDAEKLVSFLRAYYRNGRSLKTAISAIRVYLRFKGFSPLKFKLEEDSSFREFKPISKDVMDSFRNVIEGIKSEESKLAINLMVFLGLNPKQIEFLTKSSYVDMLPVPVISGKRFKRLVIYKHIRDKLKSAVSKLDAEERILKVKSDVLKVTFYNLKRKLGIKFKVIDFRENYAYELLRRGLPINIISEYSNVDVQRVSYISRFFSLKSDIEIVGEKLKDL